MREKVPPPETHISTAEDPRLSQLIPRGLIASEFLESAESNITDEPTFVVGLQLRQGIDSHLAQRAVQQLLGLVLLCLRIGRAAGSRGAGGGS